MPLFQNLRESLGGYFSPGSSKQKTKRSPSLEEVKMRLDRDSMSPTKRTSDWLKAHSGEIKTPKALGVKGSRVTKPTPTKKQSAKAQAKFWGRALPNFLSKQATGEAQGGLEGDTLVEEEHFSGVNDDDNEATLLNPDGSAIAELANPAPNAAEDEDTPYEITAKDREAMKSWSKDEISLFHKLNMRGFEPLVPGDWSSEFVTLPGLLFSDNDPEVLIKAREGNEYNACRALQSLFNLGARVRDRIACKLPPSEAIRRDLLSYYKWSIMDAGLYHVDHIPVVAIATAAPRESVASVVGRVTDSLHDLGKQYRVHFFDHIDPVSKKTVFKRQLPTLYGIVITQMIVTFVTYDSRSPARQVQTMGIYDFSKLEQDVWHALSVAIVMCKARDYLIQLKEEHQVGGELEDGESDVDA
ncbi:MAG: hypothetical protein LQ346_001661 [Caloplaca aetnensis]|nr:MAG: hypothetical protein LQ346_001661 [Caloplaca aetnensis]